MVAGRSALSLYLAVRKSAIFCGAPADVLMSFWSSAWTADRLMKGSFVLRVPS